MGRLRISLAAAVLVCLASGGPLFVTVNAAAQSGATSGPSIASVGSRIDVPLAPTPGFHGNPQAGNHSMNPHALDSGVLNRAKAAADAAAPGLAPYARNDFSISASPTSVTVVQGTSATYTVTTALTKGRAQSISLSLSSSPAGVTGTFSPQTISSGGSSTLTVPTATVALGTYSLTIKGTGTTATHSTTVSLTVTATAQASDFSVSASPASVSVAQGGNGQTTIITATTSGNPESVSLTASGLPSGVTASFNPASVTSGTSSTLTLTVSSTAATGTTTVTVTGTAASGGPHSTGVSLTVTAASSSGPVIGSTWLGESQNNLAPPDPTGAIGPSSYIEMINLRYGIYSRSGTLINDGDLGALTGFPVSELTDPQIVWDPSAQRFYYLVLDAATYAYAFGYSTTATPQSAADWCRYNVNAFYSSSLPDYPKLAVTNDFVLVGANVFLLAAIYQGSDVDWFQKPGKTAGDTSCPGSLGGGGIFSALKNADGSKTSTPVPAVNADPSAAGWVVGSANVGTGSASYLSVFKVTNSNGSAVIGPATAVGVAAYSVPADAPEAGASVLMDTMDTRLTHAVAAVDPAIGVTALWTAHTVFGGAGAESRWYEISTSGTPNVYHSGKVTSPTTFVWNGAVAPDRADNGTTGAYGSNMVEGFNTSSASTYPGIQMVSQRGGGAQSGWVSIVQSTGPNQDFSCTGGSGNVCRWGDYGGASPDPAPAGGGGAVWLSNEWNLPAASDLTTPTWQTWNWVATP